MTTTENNPAYAGPAEWQIRRQRVALDAMERPCVDCEVGEPHACPLLTERLVITYG